MSGNPRRILEPHVLGHEHDSHLTKQQRYEIAKSRADIAKYSDTEWFAAKQKFDVYNEAQDRHKFQDPKWQKAHAEYTYMKDMGLDKAWDPRWQHAKKDFEACEKAFTMSKKADPTWQRYYAEYQRVEDKAMATFFSTPELREIKQEIEAKQHMQDPNYHGLMQFDETLATQYKISGHP